MMSGWLVVGRTGLTRSTRALSGWGYCTSAAGRPSRALAGGGAACHFVALFTSVLLRCYSTCNIILVFCLNRYH